MTRLQDLRLWARITFFALFVLAPPLDLFRLDLKLGHFILFGQYWTLGLDAFLRGEAGVGHAFLNLLLRGFLPIALIIGTGVWVSWKYGRLYCGWLCPHFSVVETINALMRRAFGRPTLWERHTLPEDLPDGRYLSPNPLYWLAVGLAIVGFAFLWALSLLTYLWPPFEVYANLWHGELTRFQFLFLTAATIVFVIEFLLARHLFCRFGCAVGLFQSLAWMANKRAMVVGFERERVDACVDCDAACDNACPMRLKPRSTKRHMFTCTQCARCLQACDQVQKDNPQGPLLKWVQNTDALDVSARDFGRKGE
ncbi:MAG: 4Fe-4S binding protein [Pseudomonadota bacterium]